MDFTVQPTISFYQIGLGDIDKICDMPYCKINFDIDIYCDFVIRCDINIECDVDIKHNREIYSNITNDI